MKIIIPKNECVNIPEELVEFEFPPGIAYYNSLSNELVFEFDCDHWKEAFEIIGNAMED